MSENPLTKFVALSSTHRGGAVQLSNSAHLSDAAAAAESLAQMAAGGGPTCAGTGVYSRLHNDTVAEFEGAMAALEGTSDAVGFASGMAAMAAVLLTASARGAHVVAVRPLYGCTDHLLSSGLTGLKVTWTSADEVADAIQEDTSLVIAETPANPTLRLLDIEALVKAAGDVPVVIDSTFASPYLQNPTRHGATLSLHSATKYIGGHGDVMGGVVSTDQEWARALRQTRIVTGGVLHPLAAYLLRRGLSTLPVRMEAAQKNARALASRLVEHPAVEKVYFPGFSECDPAGLVGTQMRGPGAMIAFDLGDREKARALMASTKVITAAVSLGSTESLIQHPASLTHQIVAEEAKKAGGISAGLVRLSLGLEAMEDLWADLDQGLRGNNRS